MSTPRSWRTTEVHCVTVKAHSSTTPGQRLCWADRSRAQATCAAAWLGPLIDGCEHHGP